MNSPKQDTLIPEELAEPSSSASVSQKLLIYGLAITALIATPQQTVLPETIKGALASVITLTALAIWSWGNRKSAHFRWNFLILAPLGLAIAAATSMAWSPLHTALVEAGRWLIMGLIMLVGLNTLRRDSISNVASTAHWSAVALSLLALFQFWFDLSWFPAQSGPGATFGNRNMLAEFIAASLPFSFWVLMRKQTLVATAWRGVSTGLILVALMSTGARAALLASLAGLAMMALFFIVCSQRKKILVSGTTLLASIAAPLLVILALGWIPSLNENILNEQRGSTPIDRSFSRLTSLAKSDTYAEGSSFGIRLAAWQAGRKMIQAHPLRGIGAGAWNSVSPLYSEEDIDKEHVWLAHNEPLQLVAEFGVVGWAALLALGWLMTRVTWHAARCLRDSDANVATHALQDTLIVLSIGMLGICSLSGLPLHAPATCYLLALAIAMLLMDRTIPKNQTKPSYTAFKLASSAPFGAIALLLAACAISVQALRSDYYVQNGTSVILGLLKNPSIPKERAKHLREDAVANLKQGLSIYPDHGTHISVAADALGVLDDVASVLWLSDQMLEIRPHVVALRCNRAIAFVELRDYDAAKKELASITNARPNAPCLALARFILAFKTEDYATALPIGMGLVARLEKDAPKEMARFIVESTYRAAIRESDIDTAIAMLKVRAQRWSELRASSRLMEAKLYAGHSPDKISTQALEAFKDAAHIASLQEKPQILSSIPEEYRKALNP